MTSELPPPDARFEELLRFLRMLATEVLGDAEAARLWLRTPLPGLDNQAPIDLLDTRAGFDRARSVLLRHAKGLY
ncbi:MbcA/ParS/Xre antitoxin family protein (plasmid) [Deinococcus radiomollis]|uniref:antitoxin Xre/MbcA/ParS toxin-binding domain-containing protein n=1 Tax=Deinococcus radiomollis TaxID=468916 RepID=UPI003891FF84